MRRKFVAIFMSLLALTMLSGVAYADKPVGGVHHHGGENTTHIDMVKTKFVPKDAVASLGGGPSVTITWENHETNKTHNVHIDGVGMVTSASGDNDFVPGESGSIDLGGGAYNYHCMIHPGMKGTITINP